MDAYPVRNATRPRGRRLLKAALAAVAALSLAFTGVALQTFAPSPAVAGPVTPTAGTTSITAVGAFSGATYVVPQGICTVTATVLGGAGGSAGVAAVTNGNGSGARVTATFPVVPGMAYSGTVGGGGTQPTGNDTASTAGVGGTNGGGAGGTSGETSGVKHHGAGGGGYSELFIGGTSAILAGGGGGSGGGHSITTAGQGGNAGLPTTTGVTIGATGATGKDTTASNPQPVNTGGIGGGLTLAGAGGTNSNNASTNGTAGSGRNGGAGGLDPNPDAGGGGGGGYTGGGGGASTVGYNSQNGSSEIAGAGGGGGSSYIAASIPLGASTSTPSAISSVAGAKIASGAGNGAAGSITLVWNPCIYDLAVDKTVSPVNVPRNATVTWSVAVTNNGPSAMTQGDTVTIVDTLPGVGAKTITAISVSGGSNAVLGRGTFTCSVGVGGVMPASLDCSRPYQIGAGAANGVRGLDVGETLTVTYTQPVTEVAGTTLTNTATVTDRTTGDTNDTDTAATTVIVPPNAVNDVRSGIAIGTVVNVPVTTNDTGTLQANSVVLWNPTTLTTITSPYVVAGEGTWTVLNDVVTFTPEAGFKGDPTPVTYRVSSTNGLTNTATVTITYVPTAVDDSLDNLVIGAVATVPVLTNDNGTWNTSSLRLINPTTSAIVSSIAIAGEGTWAVSGTNITFTPLPGFVVDPTPIRYQITDTTGDVVNALTTLDYVPQAANNSSLGNALGTVVNQSVLVNDTGSFTAATLVFASNSGTTLVVPAEGTWTIQPGGVVRFTPNVGYYRDPTPVTYRVTDVTGDSVTATVTVGYVPAAVNDTSAGHAIGTVVDVSVVANDQGEFTAGSARLMNGVTPVTTLTVPGEGTWTVEAGDVIRFTPLGTFKGDPAPVTYRVTDVTGDNVTATVTVSYLPAATDDTLGNLAIGAPATVHPLTNDNGTWNNATLRLINPSNGSAVTGPVTVAGQGTWTISGTDVIFTPAPGFLVDPDPIQYRITDTTGDTVTALITLDYVPAAVNDASLGHALGTVVDQSVLTNDTGTFTVGSLVLLPGGVSSLVVPGEGTWSVQSGGVIRFTPEPGYYRDPTPVTYRITDVTGDTTTATVTVGYVPSAANDSNLGNPVGTVVTVPVLANDSGDFTAGTVRLMDGLLPVTSLVVAGEGTWTVLANDTIRFTPLASFAGDPAVVYYRVTDVTNDNVSATVTITYVPAAVDDHQGGLTVGSTASVPVLANDNGTWNTATLRLVDPTSSASVTTIVVPGEGTWSLSGTNVVFTPLGTFQLDPTPQQYRITDTTGDVATATVTLDYGPGAVNDVSLGNALGTVVALTVLTNDTGAFDTATLGFGNGPVGVGAQLVVPGQGTWEVVSAGTVQFTPLSTFLGDPTVVTYYIDDLNGDSTSATVTITYVPNASDDSDLGNAWGTDVNVAVLANDNGAFPNGSVRILDGGTPVTTLAVAGEGSWIVEANETITFHPLATFLTDPAPITYRVTDSTGDPVEAQVTVTYVPLAVDDAQGGLAIGSIATVPVLTNDHGDWVNSTLRLIHPTSGAAVTSVTVAGQGVWTISGTSLVFTPAPGFLVDPDPIDYRITDTTGDDAVATVTLDYGPGAADDTDLGNALGTAVDVSVFDNDSGTFNPATLGFGAATGPGTQLVVPGEGTWEVQAAGVIRFTPEPGFLVDPTPVRYYADDVTGDPADALITITYLPLAVDDADLNNAFGTTVNVDVLANDTGDFVAGSVRLLDGGTPVTVLTVVGEGTWTVQADDSITFVPLSTFLVDPAPVDYRVTDTTGDDVSAQLRITYLPQAVDDTRTGLAIGTVVDITVHTNDNGNFVAASTRLIDPTSGSAVTSVTVPGQGVWSFSAAGRVRFTPAPGFLTDPDPIDYRGTDSTGDIATATITLDYVPAAVDDSDLGNVMGTVVDLDVFANDSGDFDLTTLGFGAGTGVGTQLVVPGEGTWEVLVGGIVRFTPEPGFLVDPTPVRYYADDVTGDPVDALLTVTYLPQASDDADLGNVLGTNVNVDVLANDTGTFMAGTVRLMNGLLPVLTLTVSGEGVWTVQPDDTITFDPDSGFLVDPSVVHYRVIDTTGDAVSATITVTYLPQATNNSSTGNAAGATVNVNVLGNDTGTFVATSVRILDAGTPVLQLIVAGQGRWLANNDGTITFFPEVGFFGDPDPIDYRVTDVTGDSVSAQLVIDYVPVAALNQSNGNVLGAPAVVDPLANDTGTFDPTSVRLLDGATPVTTLVVPGEGTWTVDTGTGVVTFTPAPGYQGNPSPVTYQVTDVTGDTVQATITVNYVPVATDDQSLGNKEGDPVTVALLPNDAGALNVTSARLLSGGTPMMVMTVPGEGTWRMNAALGRLTFTPQVGFTGDPTPVQYRVLDVNGNAAIANVTITYLHTAALTGLAYTGMEAGTQLMGGLGAIVIGLFALVIARVRRITARHRM